MFPFLLPAHAACVALDRACFSVSTSACSFRRFVLAVVVCCRFPHKAGERLGVFSVQAETLRPSRHQGKSNTARETKHERRINKSARETQAYGLSAPVLLLQVAASGEHVLALSISGEVFSWGSNKWGRLGLGEAFDNVRQVKPKP